MCEFCGILDLTVTVMHAGNCLIRDVVVQEIDSSSIGKKPIAEYCQSHNSMWTVLDYCTAFSLYVSLFVLSIIYKTQS